MIDVENGDKIRYVVAGYNPWIKTVFRNTLNHYPGKWYLVEDQALLNLEALEKIQPKYIFFLHWSWKVPVSIVESFRCINFHMTDLPFGRGGSPLQNLILRGFDHTKLTAHRMTNEIDAGPVYLKSDLSLKGSAQEIYQRFSHLAAEMVKHLIENDIIPSPQLGKPTYFKRRTPSQSQIPEGLNTKQTYDFIRMLDADGYPRAFLYLGNHQKILFSKADYTEGQVKAEANFSVSQ